MFEISIFHKSASLVSLNSPAWDINQQVGGLVG